MAITNDWVKSLRAGTIGNCAKGWNLRVREVSGKKDIQNS